MFDRNLVRDVAFAVLLGLPTLALARPQSEIPQHPATAAPLIEQAALADLSQSERRFSLPTEG